MNSPRIFVSIASYRDPECQHTVRDLFAKAAQPERITVGICWQFDPVEDKDCFVFPPPFPAQVRSKKFDAGESKGGCWARAQAHSLLQDEEFVLQIDAHMRFVQGWDDLLVSAHKSCPTPRAALSASPRDYWPPDKLDINNSERRLITAHAFGDDSAMQPLHLGNILWPADRVPTGLMPTPFFVGNFLFIPAEAIRAIPYDPHLYFRGQELTYAARLWTHGWDIFQPGGTIVFHYWASKSRASGTQADYKQKNAQAQLARQRVWHLLIQTPAAPEALAEIEEYGMGNIRKLEDYWAFAGINPHTRTIERFANKGRWDTR